MQIFLLILIFFGCKSEINNQPEQSGDERKLVWSDEFNYSGKPDPQKWNYEIGYIRNDEKQYYSQREENVRVEDGYLVIEARNDSAVIDGEKRPVSSASLITRGKAEWQYGRIEVKAKVPKSLGSWPAIWMLGKNINQVGWPECGEIDIMEHVGYDPEVIHTNVHTEAYNHSIGTSKGKATPIEQPYNDFHVYAIEWNEQKIDFFIDQKKVHTFENENKGVEEWPFDQPFYLILNLAIGGSWGGQQGVDLNQLPQQYD